MAVKEKHRQWDSLHICRHDDEFVKFSYDVMKAGSPTDLLLLLHVSNRISLKMLEERVPAFCNTNTNAI